ncbi:DUF4123 domain-containing protein [Roseobacter weihaiensis]|uniref:DUF4123 domain-containing protein n=1 Tax=Roseobacter weihaiensis TaxID=2763262 RepID=UPI001D0BAC69|nr:DUF4123 domain-containing protein [Roseobacter sp. H9]
MSNDLASLFPHDPIKAQREDRLRTLLFDLPDNADGEPVRSYLLLDAAAAPEIATYAEAFPEPAQCLFDGAAFDDLAEVAPWLIQVESFGDALDWYLDKGWGQNWGVFVQTALPLARLKTRLKSHLFVSSEPQGKMFFKFYRPRTLRDYLPAFEADQLKNFFFKLEAYVIEGTEVNDAIRLACDAEGALVRDLVDLQAEG